MKGRKTWERGYAAGLIDGEGCISIKKVNNFNRKRNPEYSLSININLTDGQPIDFMYGAFGGTIYPTLFPKDRILPVYRWEIRRKQAIIFLKQILPFLKIKKQQAELGIRFQFNKFKQLRNGNKYLPFSKEILDRYEWYYQEMRRLKQIHLPCAAATTKRIGTQKSEAIV